MRFLDIVWNDIDTGILQGWELLSSSEVLESLGIIFSLLFLVFLVAQIKKDNSLFDVVWGLGMMSMAGLLFLFQEHSFGLSVQSLLLLVVSVWALRLALHIGLRKIGKGEDPRYAKWRKEWGSFVVIRSFFQIYLLQFFLQFIVVSPVLAALMLPERPLWWLSWLGLTIWLFGFLFEVLADWQLSRFVKQKKAGQIMTAGLWKYSRHPNYFGEVTSWWGIFLLVMSTQLWPPFWLLLMIGPLTISFLILKVSGVPMLEKRYENNPEFERYKVHTNRFFPWFPH
jgi:steroid 5-alpha reductase family enzyme